MGGVRILEKDRIEDASGSSLDHFGRVAHQPFAGGILRHPRMVDQLADNRTEAARI